MSVPVVEVTIDQRGVATVCLNRPQKHNAFDGQMIIEVTAALKSLDKNKRVRAVVLKANGKHFSAGADLNWMKRMASYSYRDNLRDANSLALMLKTLYFLSKPTIASVHGAAYGGAVGLISCCDIVVASNDAIFCLSEVRVGLIPATISPYVTAAIGSRAARRYFLTAEVFGAAQARDIGLVSELAASEKCDDTVEKILSSILQNGPEAVHQSKQLIFDVAGKPVTDALIKTTSERIAAVRISQEGQEGLAAFLEKRLPQWVADTDDNSE